MPTLLVAFFISFFTTLLVVRYRHLHDRYSGDHDTHGVQKMHLRSVPRIGGVGVMLGLVAAAFFMRVQHPEIATSFGLMLVASVPAFAGGLIEDLTKRVGVLARLFLTMAAALLGFLLLGAAIVRTGVPVLDSFLQISAVTLLFTAIAVGGVANAINIIDGFNGLAAMISVMILGGLGYVGFLVGDGLLWSVSIASVGAISGFFMWNYPRGLIFLGDGGAYLIGFLIGEISVLLVARHVEVSPFFPLLLLIYPVFETLFSIYRRKFLQGVSPGMPDALHLHTLVFRRLVRWAIGERPKLRVKQNAATSPYLWALCSVSVIPAVLFWQRTEILVLCAFAFVVIYVWLYRRIVRFRSPHLLVKRERRRQKNEASAGAQH